MGNLKLKISGSGTIDLLINGVWKQVLREPIDQILEIPYLSTVTLRAKPDPGQKVLEWLNVYTYTWFPRGQSTIAFPITTNNYSYFITFIPDLDTLYKPLPPDTTLPDSKDIPIEGFLDGSIKVGSCTCDPSYVFGQAWYTVKSSVTGKILYSGLTAAGAVSKANSDPICNEGYIPAPSLPGDIVKPLVPDGVKRDKEDEGYGEIIIVAGIGLLAIVAIYLSRRKT